MQVLPEESKNQEPAAKLSSVKSCSIYTRITLITLLLVLFGKEEDDWGEGEKISPNLIQLKK